jgi:hypothetical protein
MTDTNEPRRLFESGEAPAELRNLLRRAHEDVLPSETVARLVRAVEQRAPASPPPSALGSRPAWLARAARHSTKLLAVAAVVGLGAGAWYWAKGRGRGAHEPVRPAAPPTLLAEAPPTHAEQTAPAQVTAPDVAGQPPPARGPATAPAPRAWPAEPARPGKRPTLAVRKETDTAVNVATRPATGSPSRPADAEEYRLLRAARRALAETPARALALAEDHARRFPSGMLGQEREVIAVEALVELGRAGQASERARSFFTAYPNSPYRGRIERALGRAAGAASTP